MSNLKINGQQFSDVQLVKLQGGKADEAIAKLNTGKQGADDVVFKVGDDVFVASGRDLFPGKAIAGKPFMGGDGVTVELDGKKAEVLAWDNQANNGKECAKWSITNGALAPIVGFEVARRFKLPMLWSVAAGAAAYAATMAGAFLYGKHRKIDVSELQTLGTVVQKNTQAEGGFGDLFKSSRK